MVEVLVVETPNLGDRSYLVHDGATAAVIDPQRDIDRMLRLADETGVRIAVVAETHLHNDYLTGGLALARETGADYLVAAGDEVAFRRSPVHDGEDVAVGDFALRALTTPGHTPHHLSYAVRAGGSVVGVFTGGSLLFGTTGRPDLIGPASTEPLAHAQWRSAHRLAEELPDDASVWPTHGFGSFCSATQASGDESTIGRERTINPALTTAEAQFVAETLAGLDVYPGYYVHMAPGNAAGPSAPDLRLPPRSDAAGLAARISAGEWVVDIRPRSEFAAGHAPRTLSFDANGNVATYLGWLLPWGTPVTLCGTTADDVAAVQRELVRIGIDRPAAMAVGDPQAWTTGTVASYRRATFAELAREPEATVLDVRRESEWRDGHLVGAHHVPLHELPQSLESLPDEQLLWVHCASGFRAAIAASLLARAGHRPVHIDDEWDAAADAGLKITT